MAVPKEIVLEIKRKERKIKTIILWILLLALTGGLVFGGGFLFGKTSEETSLLRQQAVATKSATRQDWLVYETADFSIEFPKEWRLTQRKAGEIAGGKIESVGGSVEFWLKVSQSFRFSEEQKKKQTGEKTSEITIEGKSAKMTEFSYDSGGFFIIVEIPAREKSPKVTFWAVAANEEFKKIVSEIISSFKLKV